MKLLLKFKKISKDTLDFPAARPSKVYRCDIKDGEDTVAFGHGENQREAAIQAAHYLPETGRLRKKRHHRA